jgi:hypothetical protein
LPSQMVEDVLRSRLAAIAHEENHAWIIQLMLFLSSL